MNQSITAGVAMSLVGAFAGLEIGALSRSYNGLIYGAAIGEIAGMTLGVRVVAASPKAPLALDLLAIGGIGALGGALVSQVPYGAPAAIATIGAVLAQAAAASAIERNFSARGDTSRTASSARLFMAPSHRGVSFGASITR